MATRALSDGWSRIESFPRGQETDARVVIPQCSKARSSTHPFHPPSSHFARRFVHLRPPIHAPVFPSRLGPPSILEGEETPHGDGWVDVGGTKGSDVVGATRWTRPAWNLRHGHWKRWNETPKTKTNRKDGAEETRSTRCTSTTKTKGKRRHARRNQRTRNEARRTRRTSMSEAWEKEEACQRKGEETKDVYEANVPRGNRLAHPHTSHTRTDDVAPRARGANANVPKSVRGDACLENKHPTKEGTVPDERRHRNRRTLHWLTLSRWPCPHDLTCSPLHDAAQVGDLQMIQKLLNIPTTEVGNAMAVRSCVPGRRRIVD